MSQKLMDKLSVFTSSVNGFLRFAGFIGLVLIFLPVQFVGKLLRADPFPITQSFYRLLIRVLGFRVRVHGAMAKTVPVLFVANHSSYLDIPAMATCIPACFVAKAEVAGWPGIGFLAKLQNTAFIERRANRAGQQRNSLRERLEQGQSLIVFPEGTSTDGLRVLPFKSSLFSIVEEVVGDRGLTVQPVSVACTGLDGLPLTRGLRPLYAWYGDMTFMRHLWNVFKYGRFTVDIVFHAPASAQDFKDRKALARYCQEQVARGIEQCLTGRHLPAGRDIFKLPAPSHA